MTLDNVSHAPARSLPEGVVTFLFTDIEGSTKLLQQLGDAYSEVLARHHSLLRDVFDAHGGREVGTEGDAFFVAFSSAREAVVAAVDCQRVLHSHAWPHGEPVSVRMGLHTGEPLLVGDNYVGLDVHRAARICSAAHGQQVVLSARLRDLVANHVPDDVRFLDLGEHHLKDLVEPEHLLQLVIPGLPSTFPPLRSLKPPTNVPHHAAGMVGRWRERNELRALLLSPDVRLVTVTGPGGTGKTRLAAATALDMLDEFQHGVYFVDLARLREADQVMPAIARVLGVPLEANAAPDSAIAGHVLDHHMLLVLDNFEQVLPAALAVARLLETCPRLHVVATSRILLSLADEHDYPLQPMGLPHGTSLQEVKESEAAQLFVERARRARPGYTLTERDAPYVARVCTLLDGLPLAIELAAARTKLFPPAALAGRLDDRLAMLTGGAQDTPERHRALRSTIDWSYDLLPAAEQQFFRDLAVFNGGARFESLEAVLGRREVDVLDLVTSLVNHSLVRQQDDSDGEPRFTMLQILRDYADGLLRELPEYAVDLRGRHALHYLDLVERATQPEGRTDPDFATIEQEQDNIRSALSFWLEERPESDAAGVNAVRVASAMGGYWYQHGQALEGSAWLDRAVASATDLPTALEARALRMQGVMAEQRREYDRSRQTLERALALYEQIGDRAGQARCLNSLGVVARSAGQGREAERLLQAAAELRQELGDVRGLTSTLNNLGIIYLDDGEWQKARDVFQENLERDRAAGDEWGAACTALNLGVALLVGGAPRDAQPMIREAVTGFSEVDDVDGLIQALESTVGLAVARGQWVAAARLSGAAAKARETLGLPGSPADLAHLEDWVAQCQSAMDRAAFATARQEGAVMTHTQAATYTLAEVVVPMTSQRR